MLLIKVVTLIVLLVIFVQDIGSRSVYWLLFPLLAALFISVRLLSNQPVTGIWQPTIINCCFLLLQFLLVSAYFSFKKGYWVNITRQLLGWGDILFILCAAVYLSVLNFFLFYMGSLIAILFFWLIWQLVAAEKNKEIPLAGFQSLIFTAYLASDWWYLHLNLTDDNWLLHLITK